MGRPTRPSCISGACSGQVAGVDRKLESARHRPSPARRSSREPGSVGTCAATDAYDVPDAIGVEGGVSEACFGELEVKLEYTATNSASAPEFAEGMNYQLRRESATPVSLDLPWDFNFTDPGVFDRYTPGNEAYEAPLELSGTMDLGTTPCAGTGNSYEISVGSGGEGGIVQQNIRVKVEIANCGDVSCSIEAEASRRADTANRPLRNLQFEAPWPPRRN